MKRREGKEGWREEGRVWRETEKEAKEKTGESRSNRNEFSETQHFELK